MKKTVLIDSPDLAQYKLKGKPKAALVDSTEMRAYAAKANRELPAFVRLYREDYAYIDDQVRKQSDGKWNAATVKWDSLPLKRLGDA